MSPIAEAERHDPPGLVDELVPGMAAVIEDGAIGGEDPVGQPVVAQELRHRRSWPLRGGMPRHRSPPAPAGAGSGWHPVTLSPGRAGPAHRNPREAVWEAAWHP